jgi:hypothetical protein
MPCGLVQADSSIPRHHCSKFAVLVTLHHSNLVVTGDAWGSLQDVVGIKQAPFLMSTAVSAIVG